MISAHSTRSSVRRAATAATAVVAVSAASIALAGPASAGVPDGWAPGDDMSVGFLLMLVAGLPILGALVVSLLVLLPGVLRGEGLIPKVQPAPEGTPQLESAEHH